MSFLRCSRSFGYPGFAPVVDDVSSSLPAGGVHCLVGRSGCGKTTLLKLAAGLLQPSHGRGPAARCTAGGPARGRLRVPVADLLDWLTVQANVLLPVSLQRRPTAQDAAGRRFAAGATGPRRLRPALSRASCPAASRAGSHWPGPAAASRRCCCWTNPSPPSMRSRARSCSATCCACAHDGHVGAVRHARHRRSGVPGRPGVVVAGGALVRTLAVGAAAHTRDTPASAMPAPRCARRWASRRLA
jgi:energy-coupling factor transporter ATP-binding protein EcfA2